MQPAETASLGPSGQPYRVHRVAPMLPPYAARCARWDGLGRRLDLVIASAGCEGSDPVQEPHSSSPKEQTTTGVVDIDDAADRALLDRLRAGDDAAFAQLVRENTGRLLAAARRILRSDEEARDAVQEAFLQAFRGLAEFHGGARLSTWLHRIAINASLMRLRARRSRPEVAIEELLPRFYEDGHRMDPGEAWSSAALAALETDETRAFVREQIERLPEDHRNVLLLRDIQELDTDETATLLGITPGATKVRLHRARQSLRALLVPYLATVER